MTEKKTDTVQTIRDTLRFHQAMGIDEYPYNQDVQRFLEKLEKPQAKPDEQTRDTFVGAAASAGIDNLEMEINECTLCQLSRDPLGRVLGKGKAECRLMVIGDRSSQSGDFFSETLFGKEEDFMLWKMMAAIELQPDQLYVTNSLKCCPRDTGEIDEKCEESCFSYLAREIASVKPRIICAMGEMSVRVLMGKKEPLSRLRGRFGNYRYPSGQTVMVMPTFHPRFLLQHPEMKKATWNDLLLIKRRIDES